MVWSSPVKSEWTGDGLLAELQLAVRRGDDRGALLVPRIALRPTGREVQRLHHVEMGLHAARVGALGRRDAGRIALRAERRRFLDVLRAAGGGDAAPEPPIVRGLRHADLVVLLRVFRVGLPVAAGALDAVGILAGGLPGAGHEFLRNRARVLDANRHTHSRERRE